MSLKPIPTIKSFYRNLPQHLKWLLGILILLIASFLWPVHLPDRPTSTILESKDKQLLGGRIATDGQWRFPPGEQIPAKFKLALLTFEDRWFYYHPGINPVSLARAFYKNLQRGKKLQGGSTLTMQVIRLSRNNPSRTYLEKIFEIHRAISLTLQKSKAFIFNQYVAMAPFGGNAVGLEAASWRYYGKSPELLSWAEAATLAVLPNSPALIHPGRNREALKAKRDRLLSAMLDQKIIDSETFQLALTEPIPNTPFPLPRLAPELLMTLGTQQSGRIHTTIHADIQQSLLALMARHHLRLKENGIHNMAVVILDNKNGETIAYAGNTPDNTERHGGQVDIIQARRSPGSTLKPLLYAWAIQDGLILPRSFLPDIPTQYNAYRPENFYRDFQGVVPAEMAIASSLNIPMVRLLQKYGVDRFLSRLHLHGFQSLDRHADFYGLPLILGGGEISLWELAQCYGQLARILNRYTVADSRYHSDDLKPFKLTVTEEEGSGEFLPTNTHLKAGAIWSMMEAMRLPDRPEEASNWDFFSSSRAIAWKTGTSFGFKDAWCIGVTPAYTIGVWIGNADAEPRPGLTGIQTAAPLLFDAIHLLPKTDWFDIPYDDLTEVNTCKVTGFPAEADCPIERNWIPSTTNLPNPCAYHQTIWLHQTEHKRIHSECYNLSDARKQVRLSLPPVEAHYYHLKNPGLERMPDWLAGCREFNQDKPMAWISPPLEADLAMSKGWKKDKQSIIFSVAHQDPQAVIHWHLDGEYLGKTELHHQWALHLPPGEHTLVLSDQSGSRLSRVFRMME